MTHLCNRKATQNCVTESTHMPVLLSSSPMPVILGLTQACGGIPVLAWWMVTSVMWHRHFSARCHFTKLLIGSSFLTIKTGIFGLSYSGFTWLTHCIGSVWGQATPSMISRTGSLDLGGMVMRGPLAGSRIIILSWCRGRQAPTRHRQSLKWDIFVLWFYWICYWQPYSESIYVIGIYWLCYSVILWIDIARCLFRE